MAIILDGVEYVGVRELCDRLGDDIDPETVRNWTRPQTGRPPLLHPLRGTDGAPVLLDGQHWYAWGDAVEAERATRLQRRGRPRRVRA